MSDLRFHADYQCIDDACGQEWRGIAGPTECPKCGGRFAFWVDFEQKWEQRGVGFMPKPEFHDELLVCA